MIKKKNPKHEIMNKIRKKMKICHVDHDCSFKIET